MANRRIARVAVVAGLVLLAGCESERPLGKCIGLNDTPRPELRYEYSTTNIVMAFIFSETVVVPVIVVFNELECPAERRSALSSQERR